MIGLPKREKAMKMNPFLRLTEHPARIVSERRYPMIRAKIGYLCRAGTQILVSAWQLSDPACTDGALLRMPPRPFSDVYYAEMQPKIRNDSNLETAAVYFDPYAGRFVVVGSKKLYEDARDQIGTAGTPLFFENESPARFDAAGYGRYADPETLTLSYNDYFVYDVTGHTVLELMVKKDSGISGCAMRFFDEACDSLLLGAAESGPDLLTVLLASVIKEKNAPLLCRLFALIPQIADRFRLSLREEAKFAGDDRYPPITLPESGTDVPQPQLFSLFQYTVLCGDPDTMQTVFAFSGQERPLELREFLHHPMYYHVGFYHVRTGNAAALSALLSAGFPADCTDSVRTQDSVRTHDSARTRVTLLSESCRTEHPALTALLLRAGADPLRQDSAGKNAFDTAMESNAPACLSVLLSSLSGTDVKTVPVQLSAKLSLDTENAALACVLRAFLRKNS